MSCYLQKGVTHNCSKYTETSKKHIFIVSSFLHTNYTPLGITPPLVPIIHQRLFRGKEKFHRLTLVHCPSTPSSPFGYAGSDEIETDTLIRSEHGSLAGNRTPAAAVRAPNPTPNLSTGYLSLGGVVPLSAQL